MAEFKRVILNAETDAGVDEKQKQIIKVIKIGNLNPTLSNEDAKAVAQAVAGLSKHEFIRGVKLAEEIL